MATNVNTRWISVEVRGVSVGRNPSEIARSSDVRIFELLLSNHADGTRNLIDREIKPEHIGQVGRGRQDTMLRSDPLYDDPAQRVAAGSAWIILSGDRRVDRKEAGKYDGSS